MKKLLIFIVLLSAILFSCVEVPTTNMVEITNGEEITIELGETLQLTAEHNFVSESTYTWYAMNSCVIIEEDGLVTGIKEGTCIVRVVIDGVKDTIAINVVDNTEITIELSVSDNELFIGESAELSIAVTPVKPLSGLYYEIVEEEEIILTDPYENVTALEFYANYTKATSSTDAYYRSLHGFMSGDISKQNQEPTIAHYQPMQGEKYVRNTSALYSSDGNTYYIVDGYGNVVNEIYKGGGYVTLVEVAAYVLAFGDIPANYISKKSGNPSSNIWKEYLRLNHSAFSGSTTKYPYEPKLPRISGCGGDLYYYEIDLGTTGTDCDPSYPVIDYNNGRDIERGAARIVYTRYDKNKNNITDINEKYVFYTYNHYNDFQEYLNYEGGWGEMFGNITGGGTLSSKYDYNPTPYVEVVRSEFVNNQSLNVMFDFIVPSFKKEEMFL